MHPEVMTPFELIYLAPSNLCVLFKWGSIGYFCWLETGKCSDTSYASQTTPGLALVCSDHTTGMMFFDPLTKRFNISQDFTLDKNCALPQVFPGLVYDRGLNLRVKLDPGEVFESFPPPVIRVC